MNNQTKQIKTATLQKCKPQRERFVFDNIIKEDQGYNPESDNSVELMFDSNIPYNLNEMLNFTQQIPSNYEKEYHIIVKAIKTLYKDLIGIMYQEKLNLDKMNENINSPIICLEHIKELIKELIEKYCNNLNKKQSEDYEILLQKAEAKLRDHIRNEQQLKVAIETLQIKIEDNENAFKKSTYTLDIKFLKELNDENKRLKKVIKEREEEVYTFSKGLEELKEKIMQLEANNKALTLQAQEKQHEVGMKTILHSGQPPQKLIKTRSDKSWGGIIGSPDNSNGISMIASLLPKTPTPTRIYTKVLAQESLSTGLKSLRNQLNTNRSASRGSPSRRMNDIVIQENQEYESTNSNNGPNSGPNTCGINGFNSVNNGINSSIINNSNNAVNYQDRLSQMLYSKGFNTTNNKPPLRERDKSANLEKSINNVNANNMKNKESDINTIRLQYRKATESVNMISTKMPKKSQQYESLAHLRDLTSSNIFKKNIFQDIQDAKKIRQQRTISDLEYDADKLKLKSYIDAPLMKIKGRKSHENIHHLFNKSFTTEKPILSVKPKKKF